MKYQALFSGFILGTLERYGLSSFAWLTAGLAAEPVTASMTASMTQSTLTVVADVADRRAATSSRAMSSLIVALLATFVACIWPQYASANKTVNRAGSYLIASLIEPPKARNVAPILAAPANGLSVVIQQPLSQLLTSSAVSCAKTAVSPLRFALPSVQISWQGKRALQGTNVVLAFQHANFKDGRVICEITDAEFDSVFGTVGATVNAQSNLTVKPGCAIECGGLQVNDTKLPFVAAGTLNVIGTTSEPGSGFKIQEHAVAAIQLHFTP